MSKLPIRAGKVGDWIQCAGASQAATMQVFTEEEMEYASMRDCEMSASRPVEAAPVHERPLKGSKQP